MSYTFISYSRKQLYFAESLALALQRDGCDIWFDLQQLEAGADWAQKLQSGVDNAGQMILVVSPASLHSPYTRVEWETHLEKGKPLLLAIYEPVALPPNLVGRPTVDMTVRFDEKVTQLSSYLSTGGAPLPDSPPPANALPVPTRLPFDIWLVAVALSAPLLALVISFANLFRILSADDWFSIAVPLAIIAAVSAFSAYRWLGHRLQHSSLLRALEVSLFLQLLVGWVVYFGLTSYSGDFQPLGVGGWVLFAPPLAVLIGLTLFACLVTARRSPFILRWFGAGQVGQNLRRRLHEPLVRATSRALTADRLPAVSPVHYALHFDKADQPLARRIENAFGRVGHTQVADPAQATHHVALITNRSSQAWVQKITAAYQNQLVFVIGSTIDFKQSLSETGQYQWIDFRGGDRRDIEVLARSIGNPLAWKFESALEATPTRINELLLPPGMAVLKALLQIFGALLIGLSVHPLTIYNGMTMTELVREFGRVQLAMFPLTITPVHVQAAAAIVIGLGFLWLSGHAILDRRMPKQLVYLLFYAGLFYAFNFIDGGVFSLAISLGALPVLFLTSLYTLPDGYHWLPGFSKRTPDEVGIEKSNLAKARRQNIMWALSLTALFIYLGSMQEVAHY